MDLAQLLDTKPENLAQKQRDALIKHVVDVLDQVKQAIVSLDSEKLEELTFFSGAGDGMGSDNTCINFQFAGKHDAILDVQQAFDMIAHLDDLAGPKNSVKPYSVDKLGTILTVSSMLGAKVGDRVTFRGRDVGYVASKDDITVKLMLNTSDAAVLKEIYAEHSKLTFGSSSRKA
jgi:hypothetical protein